MEKLPPLVELVDDVMLVAQKEADPLRRLRLHELGMLLFRLKDKEERFRDVVGQLIERGYVRFVEDTIG